MGTTSSRALTLGLPSGGPSLRRVRWVRRGTGETARRAACASRRTTVAARRSRTGTRPPRGGGPGGRCPPRRRRGWSPAPVRARRGSSGPAPPRRGGPSPAGRGNGRRSPGRRDGRRAQRAASCISSSVGSARSALVITSAGSMPASQAATRQRSMRRGRGSGSVTAVTMSMRSTFATMTRSTGSVSSAVRRSRVRRGWRRTMRARVSGSPEASPTRATSSPTTMPLRPSSRAFIARTRTPSTSTSKRPRSTARTRPVMASLWAGRCLVRGREPRLGGRTLASASE